MSERMSRAGGAVSRRLAVLLSLFTATAFTLVFAPLLVVSVVPTVLIVTVVVTDSEGNWLEGAMLIALYGMIAAVFWRG